MHYKSKCDGAVAQARVLFFDLLTGVFLIAFVEKLVPDVVLIVISKDEFKLLRLGQLLFPEKQLLLILWQIKNNTLAGFF